MNRRPAELQSAALPLSYTPRLCTITWVHVLVNTQRSEGRGAREEGWREGGMEGERGRERGRERGEGEAKRDPPTRIRTRDLEISVE